MKARALQFDVAPEARPLVASGDHPESGWRWIDIEAGAGDVEELVGFVEDLGLDTLAVRDAIEDLDLPKADDFGSSMLVILHALGDERVETYEIDCFLTARHLVTIRRRRSNCCGSAPRAGANWRAEAPTRYWAASPMS